MWVKNGKYPEEIAIGDDPFSREARALEISVAMEMAAKDAVELRGKDKEVDIQYEQRERKQRHQDKSASRPKVVLDVVIHDIHQIIADLKTLIVMTVGSEVI
jgi:hypothetical protein